MNKKSVHGFVLVDKEKGVSSFFVLKQLKVRLSKIGIDVKNLKIGHAGTLDPIATGLLIVAIGEATKLLEYIVGQDKVYEAECVFGAVTDTYDADGIVESVDFGGQDFIDKLSVDSIKKVVQQFTGVIDQIPPKFSAKKIGGISAYKLARKGEEIEMKSCKVNVDKIEISSFKWPSLKMRVECGSGTYIRSLIHDIGGEIGCGAYMSGLRRVSIGNFRVEDAVKVDDFVLDNIVSIDDGFVELPIFDFDETDMEVLNKGNFVDVGGGDHGDRGACGVGAGDGVRGDVDGGGESFAKNGAFLGRCNGKIFAVLECVRGGEVFQIKTKKKLNVFV